MAQAGTKNCLNLSETLRLTCTITYAARMNGKNGRTTRY